MPAVPASPVYSLHHSTRTLVLHGQSAFIQPSQSCRNAAKPSAPTISATSSVWRFVLVFVKMAASWLRTVLGDTLACLAYCSIVCPSASALASRASAVDNLNTD